MFDKNLNSLKNFPSSGVFHHNFPAPVLIWYNVLAKADVKILKKWIILFIDNFGSFLDYTGKIKMLLYNTLLKLSIQAKFKKI